MQFLRVIGDVHGQIEPDDLLPKRSRFYLQIIRDAPYSVQIGDMGDRASYGQLINNVDSTRHRLFPGNHDHYDQLPPHSLGDFGLTNLRGIEFFFIRGAASIDRDKLVQLGRDLGKKLWFPEEELSSDEMDHAESAYREALPQLVLRHDAPTEIALWIWQSKSIRYSAIRGSSTPTRTNAFLSRLLEFHRPRIWMFGHHHRDWSQELAGMQFRCVGELSCCDLKIEENTGEIHIYSVNTME